MSLYILTEDSEEFKSSTNSLLQNDYQYIHHEVMPALVINKKKKHSLYAREKSLVKNRWGTDVLQHTKRTVLGDSSDYNFKRERSG